MLQYITHRNGLRDEVEGARAALEGGCRWVQLRMKNASDADFEAAGREIARMCRHYGATFILDDKVEMVEKLGADGVHLGKNDMRPDDARRILGKDRIIGATANTLDDMLAAVERGADYIGLGPFRFTTTKEKLSPVLGLEGYAALMPEFRKVSGIPVVAIGGILEEDIPDIMAAGVTGVALSGVIMNAPDPRATTENILKLLKRQSI